MKKLHGAVAQAAGTAEQAASASEEIAAAAGQAAAGSEPMSVFVARGSLLVLVLSAVLRFCVGC
jgi:hypothetical protein